MLPCWTELVLIIPAVLMSVQDFRNRHIAVWTLALFALGTIGIVWGLFGAITLLTNTASNICLLLLMFGIIAMWFMVAKKGGQKSLKRYIGRGDVLFMVAVTPLFGLREYLYWLIISMIAALLWWIMVCKMKLDQNLTVPLAGIMGIVLSFWIVTDIFV